MALFNPAEWLLFAAACRRRPWQVPGYVFHLTKLVMRRFVNRLRPRLSSDIHKGLKVRPTWLPGLVLSSVPSVALSFPHYPEVRADPLVVSVTQQALDANDPEAYFSRHRWSECVLGTLTGDAVAGLALDAAQAWMRNPPPKNDIAWETYSASERVANIAVLLAAYPQLQSRIEQPLLIAFLRDSAQWINTHLEYYGPVRTNNHFFNNARALIIAGSVLGDIALVECGLTIFSRFAPQLFSSAGFLRERSSHYHLIVANWLFDGLHFAKAAGDFVCLPELEKLAEEVARASTVLNTVMPEMDVHIGDISPDIHPCLTLARWRQLYPVALSSSSPGLYGDWLFIARNRDTLMACVPHAWPPILTHHGHADLGSFIWKWDGRTLLADPGRVSYLSHSTSMYQVSAAGHNTLLVNGYSPLTESLLLSGFWFPRAYADAFVETDTMHDGFIIRHDGFTRLAGVGQHQRQVSLMDNGLQVIDTLEGKGRVEVKLNWHFPPGFEPCDNLTLIASDFQLNVESISSNIGHCETEWVSYPFSAAYGKDTNATGLSVRWVIELPCMFTTRLKVMPCAA